MVGSIKKAPASAERLRRPSFSKSHDQDQDDDPPTRKRKPSWDQNQEDDAQLKSGRSRMNRQARGGEDYFDNPTQLDEDSFDAIEAPTPDKPKRARMPKGGAAGASSSDREKKPAVLTIILTQFFWAVSRKPSSSRMQTLAEILAEAKRRHWFDDKVDLASLQTWFRNKRFHVRKSLQGLFDHVQERDAADVKSAGKFFATLARCFGQQDLAVDNDVVLDQRRQTKREVLAEDVEFVKPSDGDEDD